MNPSRFPWIDWLKSLGILLVVAGHTRLPAEQHRWIYAFHMPLFFMISGFLVSPGGFSVSFTRFFQHRILKLLKLYLLFGLLGMAVFLFMFRHEQPLAEMIRSRLFSLAYASASHDAPRDLFPVVLWYFPALIVALSFTFLAWKLPLAFRGAALTGLFAAGAFLTGRALPWEIESACLASGFIALGHCARIHQWEQHSARTLIPISLAALLIGSAIALFATSSLDLRAASLGNPLISLPIAFLLVAALTALFQRLRPARLPTAISAATILIFPTHTMAFPYVDRIAAKIPLLSQAVSLQAPWFSWSKALLIVLVTAAIHTAYRLLSARFTRQTSPPG